MGEEAVACTLSPPWDQNFLTQNSCSEHCLCYRGLDKKPPAAEAPMGAREVAVVRMATDEVGEPADWWDEVSSAVAQGTGPVVNDEASRDAGGVQQWYAVDVEDVAGAGDAARVVDVEDAAYVVVGVVDAAGDGQAVASPGLGGGDARKRRNGLAKCRRFGWLSDNDIVCVLLCDRSQSKRKR